MSKASVKSVGLVVMVVMVAGVCAPCETDPKIELDQPTAQVNASTVTITVDGEEGWCTNFPPYHDYVLYAAVHRIHGGQDIGYPNMTQDDPDWTYEPAASCGLGGFVKRDYAPFTIVFEDVPFEAGDRYYVHVQSNEGEGFDKAYATSPEVAP